MKKFAFIGAGSLIFTRNLIRDILTFPAFKECEIALMDINPARLEYITAAANKIAKEMKAHAKIISTQSRAEALTGADGVLCTIFNGDIDVWRHDIDIPKKYGVDINIGDTRSISGIFRALRNIPVMLDICHDIEKYCPSAVFLNYTNPMAMLCKAMQSQTKVNVTGLCHSVQGTAAMLAGWIGAPMNEVTYTCAGINHQAFYLDFKWNGKDAYPLIKEAIEKPEIYNREQIRNEMFKHLDYYVTESSGHNSEYVAWFRKRPDLIEKYCTTGTGWNPGHYAYILNSYRSREHTWQKDIEDWLAKDDINLTRGHEYAAYIFNAVFGDNEPFEFNGNVPNIGLLSDLPENCCVEVPVFANKKGLNPVAVGKLPPQLALLNNISVRCEELAVEAAITGDARKAFHAVLFDPLTSAVLSMQETQDMVDEMFEANKDYLGHFKK